MPPAGRAAGRRVSAHADHGPRAIPVPYRYHDSQGQGLERLSEPLIEVNPKDAEKLGIADGEVVKISSRRGTVSAKAKLTKVSPEGVVYMNFHFAESAANILTNAALDPVAKIPEYKVARSG